MTILLNILLGIAASILFFGVVGETDKEKQRNITMSFVVLLLFILALNLLV